MQFKSSEAKVIMKQTRKVGKLKKKYLQINLVYTNAIEWYQPHFVYYVNKIPRKSWRLLFVMHFAIEYIWIAEPRKYIFTEALTNSNRNIVLRKSDHDAEDTACNARWLKEYCIRTVKKRGNKIKKKNIQYLLGNRIFMSVILLL